MSVSQPWLAQEEVSPRRALRREMTGSLDEFGEIQDLHLTLKGM